MAPARILAITMRFFFLILLASHPSIASSACSKTEYSNPTTTLYDNGCTEQAERREYYTQIDIPKYKHKFMFVKEDKRCVFAQVGMEDNSVCPDGMRLASFPKKDDFNQLACAVLRSPEFKSAYILRVSAAFLHRDCNWYWVDDNAVDQKKLENGKYTIARNDSGVCTQKKEDMPFMGIGINKTDNSMKIRKDRKIHQPNLCEDKHPRDFIAETSTIEASSILQPSTTETSSASQISTTEASSTKQISTTENSFTAQPSTTKAHSTAKKSTTEAPNSKVTDTAITENGFCQDDPEVTPWDTMDSLSTKAKVAYAIDGLIVVLIIVFFAIWRWKIWKNKKAVIVIVEEESDEEEEDGDEDPYGEMPKNGAAEQGTDDATSKKN